MIFMYDDWDISYDIDDLIEPQNKKKNMFAKTFNEITPNYQTNKSAREPYEYLGDLELNPKRYDAEAHIEFMTPDEYLKKARISSYQATDDDLPEDTKQFRRQNINQYKENATAGDKFPMPSLSYNFGQYMGQDGIRRVRAAKELGTEKIPVVVEDFGFGDYSNLRNSYKNIKQRRSTEKKQQNPFTFEEELI